MFNKEYIDKIQEFLDILNFKGIKYVGNDIEIRSNDESNVYDFHNIQFNHYIIKNCTVKNLYVNISDIKNSNYYKTNDYSLKTIYLHSVNIGVNNIDIKEIE